MSNNSQAFQALILGISIGIGTAAYFTREVNKIIKMQNEVDDEEEARFAGRGGWIRLRDSV